MRPESPPAPSAVSSASLGVKGFFRAVIFDMDGLLLNTEVLARRSLYLAGAEFDLELDDEACALMIGMPAEASRRLLLGRFGEDAPVDNLLAAAGQHLRSLIAGGALELKPGAAELLDHLEYLSLPRALATSSSRDKALHHLRAAGIAENLDPIVTRDDVARGKPYPDVYQQAARRLGVPPLACLALEDSYNGVRAAASAGVPVVMVPDLLPPTPEMQSKTLAIFDDLHAVLAWLQLDAVDLRHGLGPTTGTSVAPAGKRLVMPAAQAPGEGML